MNDEPFVTATDSNGEGLAQVPPADSQEQTQETVVTVPLSEVEKIVNSKLEQERSRLSAEREGELRRIEQSLGAKAYNRVMKTLAPRLQSIQEFATDEGWTAEDVQARQNREIAKAFRDAALTPDTPEQPHMPTEAYQAQSPTPPAPTISRAELVNILRSQGLDEGAIDLSKYEGEFRDNAGLAREWDEDILLAKAKQIEQRKLKKQQAAQAQQTAAVKQEFGSVASPTASAPSAGYDPVAELDKMNAEDPPNNPKDMQAWLQRRDKIKKEAAAKLGWR